jgi:dephospho-CoA kinase
MEPGQSVYTAITQAFGPEVVRPDGALDRRALAQRAFQQNQADVLNRIVHPAVVAAEEQWMQAVFAADPARVAVVESALIFEVERWGTAPGWIERFDKLILVTVPDEIKIERYVARIMGPEDSVRREVLVQDARARLAAQIPDGEKVSHCDYVIDNTGPLESTRRKVEEIYRELAGQAMI